MLSRSSIRGNCNDHLKTLAKWNYSLFTLLMGRVKLRGVQGWILSFFEIFIFYFIFYILI